MKVLNQNRYQSSAERKSANKTSLIWLCVMLAMMGGVMLMEKHSGVITPDEVTTLKFFGGCVALMFVMQLLLSWILDRRQAKQDRTDALVQEYSRTLSKE